jgi:probable LLM family oxidoreductase
LHLRSVRDETQDDPLGVRRACGPKHADPIRLEGGRSPRDTGVVRGCTELAPAGTIEHSVQLSDQRPSSVLFDYSCGCNYFPWEQSGGGPCSPRMMEVGVDSFAAALTETSIAVSQSDRLRDLLEEIEHADQVGLDVFGVGEHHRKEFLDSAPAVILAAAAARTKRIRLTSAVAVLSAADPVRLFQEFATLDLISQGRAEMVVGRGSFIEAFPLFGLNLEDYDSLFAEKLDLLLKIRENERVHWSGRHRPALTGQAVYPRPLQNPLPIWLGVGGTPESFVRAGALGLPLMVAIIGGETRRFRPLVDLYREAGRRAGFSPDRLKVGVHSLGYVAETAEQAADEFFPGYARAFTTIGKERGWGPITRAQFEAQITPNGALLVGTPEEVAAKILRHSEALGGISRITFMMNGASLPHAKLMSAIALIGSRVAPVLRQEVATAA